MRSCRGRLVWILLAVVGLLLIVAVASVAVYLVLQRPPSTTVVWQDPILATLPDELAPDLALYPLAGAAELDTVDTALANLDLETAYATLVFGLDMSVSQRIGTLGASSRNSRPSCRVRLATERTQRSCHSSW